MRRPELRPTVRLLAAAAALACAAPAPAQVILNAPGFVEKKGDKGMPDVKPAPLAWPRLDPGAVFCRTEGDLDRIAARRRGEGDAGPTDCRVMTAPTAVTVVARKGGRSQVRFTDAPAIVGWTDVWLPEKAPPGPARAPGR